MESPLVFQRTPPDPGRRKALRLMAASFAMAQAACRPVPRELLLPYVDPPEARAQGLPVFYASAFPRDGHAHGVLVGTREGRPIKIEGNPSHPSTLGGTDVFDQASVLGLWDPDRSPAVHQRLPAPAARTRAAPPMAPSTWPAFEAAWRERAQRLDARAGDGLHLLLGPSTSPTLRAQLDAVRQRWPRARWYRHDPLADEAARAGAQLAFGRQVQPVRRFDRARCIVAFAADPFSDGPAALRHAADWAALRREGRVRQQRFAAEVAPGLFGVRAQRIALAPGQIDALLWRIGSALVDGTTPAGDTFEARLVRALRDAGPDALLVPGPSLSPASHALVHALHQKLGALGRTLDLVAPLTIFDDALPLPELVRAIDAGAVDALVVLDANPAYAAAGGLDVAAALAKVEFSVHAGLHSDETARLCAWHLPLSHAYEQWSDLLAHDGSPTLMQPAILPIYDTRSLHEIVALLVGDDERDGRRLVRAHWRERVGAGFDAFWEDSLRRGVVDGAQAPALALPAAHWPEPAASAGHEMVAVCVADPSLHDGRFANNAWLQELPRPFSKLSWDNAMHMAPATAQRLGVRDGDVVCVRAGARRIEAPVWVQRGHADGAVTLPLGYGRPRAGSVGTGVGFDAYPLQTSDGAPLAVELEPTGRRHDFALAQHEMDPHGRDPARAVQPGQTLPRRELPSLYPEWDSAQHAWAMVIDLDACIGCRACVTACQAENNIPVVGKEQVALGRDMLWLRVDRYDRPDDRSIFQPVPCMHCEKAPCETVCPVGATLHDSGGLNLQVYNRCIGTRYCSNNCPYKVRRFNFLLYADIRSAALAAQRNPDVTVRARGVMEKCTYCLQRITRGLHGEQRTGVPLADGDVVTACEAACPTKAIHFGDLRLADSEVARLRGSPRHYVLLEELNTRPRTTYLARLDDEREA